MHVLTCPPRFRCQSSFQSRCSSIRPARDGSSQEPVLTALSQVLNALTGLLWVSFTCAHIGESAHIRARAPGTSFIHPSFPFSSSLLCDFFPPSPAVNNPLFGLVVGKSSGFSLSVLLSASHDWVHLQGNMVKEQRREKIMWISSILLEHRDPFHHPLCFERRISIWGTYWASTIAWHCHRSVVL